jgi:structure-specific recognition protein 1
MRLYFPKDEDSQSTKDKASKFLTRVLAKADIISASGKGLVTFSEVPVLTPRGRYGIEMFPSFMKLHGKTFDYKIKYSNIVRLFQLPKPDGRHQMFVVSLEPPIRQGYTVYPHIVMQIPEQDEAELKPNIPKELDSDERVKQLVTIASSSTKTLCDLIPRVFKCLSGKRVTVPKTFKSKEGGSAIKCSFKANEGYLFPLERSFFFVHKPPTYIRFDEIGSVDFLRVTNDSTNRTFDLGINLNNNTALQFKSLQRDEYSGLFNFFTKKKIVIRNFQDVPAGIPDDLPSDEDVEDEKDTKKRSSRRSVTDVRLRVRRAMQTEQIDSDESDKDFGFDDQNPEEDDVQIDSAEIDSTSEIEEEKAGSPKTGRTKKRKREPSGPPPDKQ